MKNGKYELVYAPDTWPGNKYKGKLCLEHHYVVWKFFGIVIKDNLVVHHKNGDTRDNRPENLEVMTRSDHSKMHTSKQHQIIDVPKRLLNTDKKRHPFPKILFKAGEKKNVISQLRYCKKCKNICSKGSKSSLCLLCYKKTEVRMKIRWPSDDKLASMVFDIPMSTLSKLLGVSDVAIKKRCKYKGIKTPVRGYWAKVYANKRYNTYNAREFGSQV